MIKAKGIAAMSAKSELAPFSFERRDPKEHDVVIDIKYCGICLNCAPFLNNSSLPN
jgi:uncharacterized zinc-type alcohol dehydrogenase-like protein